MAKSINYHDYASFFQKRTVMICQHTACRKAGAAKVFEAFEKEILPEDIDLQKCECQGQCSSSPTVRIIPEETWYCRVQPRDVPQIVQEHLKDGNRVEHKLNPRIHLYR